MADRTLADAWRLAHLRRRASPQRAARGALAVLVTVLGGLSLGSIAMARRTAGSLTDLLATTHPSTMLIEPAGGQGLTKPGEAARLAAAVRRYPGVTSAQAAEGVQSQLLSHGHPVASALNSDVIVVASVNGLFLDMDRVTLVQGRLPVASRADEVVVTPLAASLLHLHVGSTMETAIRGVSGPVALRVVGEGVLARSIVQDEIGRFPTYVIATPALAQRVKGSSLVYIGVRLRDGASGVARTERRWETHERFFTDYRLTSQTVDQASQSLRPLALALGAFGAIAGAAALLLAGQSLARLAAARRRDREVLRALGASGLDLVVDDLPATLAVVVAGSVCAGLVAVALSPLGPLGPVGPYLARHELSLDPLVVGVGVGVLLLALAGTAVLVSARNAPSRRRVSAAARARRPVVGAAIARSGAPVSAVTGARFAFESDPGRSAPTRWAIVGSVVALAVLGATLTFGESLSSLATHPGLYGWNWDYAVQSTDGYGPVPGSAVASSPGVTVSGDYYATMSIDGDAVPVLLATPRAPVAPRVFAGHGLDARDQVILGAATMAELKAHIGSVVSVVFVPGYPRVPLRVRVVGEATMPAIGIAEGLHTSMGVGAILAANADKMTEAVGPLGYGGNCNGPSIVFVRSRDHRPTVALAAARSIAARANRVMRAEPASASCAGDVASVIGVQRPAQIVNYRSMGTTPLVLSAALVLGALSALAASLVASVARRRREMAVLKSLGLTQRQLVAAVAWQAGLVAAIGAATGLPLGVVAGRWLWDLFAREIGAVPSPAVPVGGLVVVGLGALALALLTALVPGLRAARARAGEALHAE